MKLFFFNLSLFNWIKRVEVLFFPKKLDKYMSFGLRLKSFKTHDASIRKFKERRDRKPTRRELGRIIINDSHKIIQKRGTKGHWRRQKIRRMLFEDHNIQYKPK
jgi:hypothetical protein